MLKLFSTFIECCKKVTILESQGLCFKTSRRAKEGKNSHISSLLPLTSFEMIVGGHGDVNPNSSWLNGKGFWLSYGLAVLLLHLMLLCLPFISTAVAWTLTNLIHNSFMLIFLHIVKGAPFEPLDQGKTRSLTHWEQIDYGKRFTVTRKFLTVVPVILFVLTSFYTKYDTSHFIVNIIALVAVLLPKLPHFHRVWLFDSNDHSYWKRKSMPEYQTGINAATSRLDFIVHRCMKWHMASSVLSLFITKPLNSATLTYRMSC